MSRPLDELVEVIRDGEELTFDADAVWRRSQRRARQLRVHRRAAAAVVACAAVAAVIVAPSVLLQPRFAAPGPAASGPAASGPVVSSPAPTDAVVRTRAVLSATLLAVTDDEWVIAPARTTAELQIGYFRRAGETKTSGSIEVYEPGAFEPASLLAGTKTTVHGVTGYFAVIEDPFSGDEHGANRDSWPTLAWAYGPDSWVVVRLGWPADSSAQLPDELSEVAGLVRLGDPQPVRLPFRVGYRPAGVVPVMVLHYEAAGVNRAVFYEYSSAPTDYRDGARELYLPLQIAMQPAIPRFWKPDTTVGGRPAMRNGSNQVIIANGDQWITIGSGPYAPPLSTQDVERIFTDLTLAADWNNRSTWFDANTAA